MGIFLMRGECPNSVLCFKICIASWTSPKITFTGQHLLPLHRSIRKCFLRNDVDISLVKDFVNCSIVIGDEVPNGVSSRLIDSEGHDRSRPIFHTLATNNHRLQGLQIGKQQLLSTPLCAIRGCYWNILFCTATGVLEKFSYMLTGRRHPYTEFTELILPHHTFNVNKIVLWRGDCCNELLLTYLFFGIYL